MSQKIVQVGLEKKSYEIVIGSDDMQGLGAAATKWHSERFPNSESRLALIVADENVAVTHAKNAQQSLKAAGWTTQPHILPAGEATKNLTTISHIYDKLVSMRADRRTVVVAVGGGVTGDAAGFAAASYARGIPFLQVPTTLLAHVDSSVGGKTGVNHPQGKNLIGAFHQPIGVYIDINTLNTLPDRDYRSGLAEVVKYGVILDEEFFAFLESNISGLQSRQPDVMRHIIQRSCELKAHVVEEDEFETTGLRAILNYGHTYAHAFEKLAQYSDLLHGEAVAIGMVCGSRLAQRLGRIHGEVTQRQIALLKQVGLPVEVPDALLDRPKEILAAMRLDKKNVDGQLKFILPTKIGHVEMVHDVAEDAAMAVIC